MGRPYNLTDFSFRQVSESSGYQDVNEAASAEAERERERDSFRREGWEERAAEAAPVFLTGNKRWRTCFKPPLDGSRWGGSALLLLSQVAFGSGRGAAAVHEVAPDADGDQRARTRDCQTMCRFTFVG